MSLERIANIIDVLNPLKIISQFYHLNWIAIFELIEVLSYLKKTFFLLINMLDPAT